MPESPVQNLPLATTIKDRDRTVLEQDNEAKGMMMQDLIRYLFTASDKGGVWGIHVGSNQPAGTQNLWIDTSTSPVTLKIRDTAYPDIWTSVPVISQPVTQDDFRRWNLDINHPVGSWWWSDSAVNPKIILGGGEWEQVSGQFLIGADGGAYKVTTTGGEAEHVLTEAELPEIDGSFATAVTTYHTTQGCTGHAYGTQFPDIPEDERTTYGDIIPGVQLGYGFKFGSGEAHNNLPPYYATYMWRRIA